MTTHRVAGAMAIALLAFGLAACGSDTDNNSTTVSSGPSAATSSTAAASTSTAGTSAARSTAPSSTTRSTTTATSGSSGDGGDDSVAAAYCQQQGGQVQTRTATYGTNGDQSKWLPLGETTTMCRFQADDEAQSRIYVDLTTLSSTEPTLAALAYLSKVPMPASSGGANPASGYCTTELSGSSTFGTIGASGGGWVAPGDPNDVVVSLCAFPDLSFIDVWGLAYHSNGDIRGTDLATAMKYQPDGNLPPVFPTGTVTPTS